LLFSAAGNENESFWQGAYEPTQLSPPLTCSANGQPDAYAQAFGTSLDETLTLSAKLRAPIYLQWADPVGQNRSNFDLYVLDSNHNVLECIPGAGGRNVYVIDPNPQLPRGRYYLIIATPDTEFAGKFLKLLVYGNGAALFSATTPGAIASPQKLLSRVVTVGAVYGGDGVGSNIELYSSTGPVQLQFPTPTSLQAPVLVAPDGIYIDATDTKFRTGSDGLFYGTSASTPNVAAVGALLRATFPTLNAQRIVNALTNGAVPLGVSAPNGVFGYGRVDAVGALQTLARPTISRIANITVVGGTSSSAVVTLGGTGKLTLSGTSDNAGLVSFAAAGAQFAPATCGSSTNSCTLIITPALGQVGTAHLVISATDGAGRSTSTSLTVTVTEPSPPTVSVTSGGNQSLQAGNAASLITLSLSGTKQLTISVTSSNAALLPASSATLSSGCGTSSLTCTVSLRPIAGQSGQATLTVIAHDPYGQSAQSTLSVNVAAAGKSGGGGAFDCWSLIILGILLAGSMMQSQSRRLIRRSAAVGAKR
jgi:Subtilase family